MSTNANKLDELKIWLAQFPEGSNIVLVETSIFGDDASIMIKTPDGAFHTYSILGELAHK